MPALQDASQNRMSLPSDATDAAVIKAFAGIPALLEQSPALIARGRLLDCDCLLGPAAHPFHASGPDAVVAICLSRHIRGVDGILAADAEAGLA